MAEVVDQQQTAYDYEYLLGDYENDERRWAQAFQLSGEKIVTSVEVRRGGDTGGTPSGNWTLRIETDVGGVPSGTLADANASIVVVPPAENTIIKGTFATSFILSAATTYWLVIQCDNQSTSVYWRINATEPGAYGYDCGRYLSGSWGALADRDLYFKVYVDAGTPAETFIPKVYFIS